MTKYEQWDFNKINPRSKFDIVMWHNWFKQEIICLLVCQCLISMDTKWKSHHDHMAAINSTELHPIANFMVPTAA